MSEPTTENSERICVLVNRKAGRRRGGALADELRAAFNKAGARPEIRLLRRGEDFGDAVDCAKQDGFGVIVAAGGDGTIASAANTLRGAEVHFGIIPLGTFNYFARSIGVPETIEGAVAAVVKGTPRALSVATLNGRVFLNNANFGVYPDMLADREANYARWGRSRVGAYWSALTTLTRLPRPLALRITAPDTDVQVRTPVAFIFANAFQMRQMGLEGAACVEDGKLAVLIAPNEGRWGLIKSGFALLFGRMTRGHDFSLISATEVEITTKRKSLRLARDGERERLRGPYKFATHDKALTVMVPCAAPQN